MNVPVPVRDRCAPTSLITAAVQSLMLCMSAAPAWAQTQPVFILAGQSNMEGGGYGSSVPPETLDPQTGEPYNYLIRDYATDVWYGSDGWIALQPDEHNRFGPELSFGESMGDVSIVKVADPASSLYRDWRTDAPAEGRQDYPRFIDHIQTLGVIADAVFWQQGESDAHASTAPSYHDNLVDLIATTRADLGDPDLPFFIGALPDWHKKDGTPVIRQAQQDVAAADPNVYYIETSSLTDIGDSVHFDGPSLVTLGQMYADA